MTLLRMAALNKGWRLTPPMADSVAAIAIWLGAVEPPKRDAPRGGMQQMIEELGGSGFQIERSGKRG